ncbi:BgTH12-06630 [Blumeria graminis f. sp. triticale]|uniref:BgTH12-06630 n=1 Tax=Blumeria graminis f. sp. triticale TaxID=1689686 RepID=A0A9W4CYP6_BLUGR|nr:BgTH12-06630 [Blumeria graminis f. sp. triticale]
MSYPLETQNSLFQQSLNTISLIASYLKVPIYLSSGIAALLSTTLYLKQKTLIYPSNVPSDARSEVLRPSRYDLHDYEEIRIPTTDSESLHAFYIRAPDRSRIPKNITVIMFHGNAGNIGHRLPIAKMLVQNMGYHVLMVEYRGYGLSTGSPDEVGLMKDAEAAYLYIRQRADLVSHNIIIYGQSIGGAVSIQLTAKFQDDIRLNGLILENTFLSMRKLIPSIIPSARYLTPLCHQIWDTENFIPKIRKIPILFLSGLKDEIVPPNHMRQLYEISQAISKVWKPLPNGDHNTSVLEEGYFESIENFIQNLEPRTREQHDEVKSWETHS